jgi:maleylacetate reductase
MDEVVFGRPAAPAVAGQIDSMGSSRALLMVSGTLNRQTGEIEKIHDSPASRCVATLDAMPPHTPREAVIAAPVQVRAILVLAA